MKDLKSIIIEEMIKTFLNSANDSIVGKNKDKLTELIKTVGLEVLGTVLRGSEEFANEILRIFKNSYEDLVDIFNDKDEVEKEMEKINEKMDGGIKNNEKM